MRFGTILHGFELLNLAARRLGSDCTEGLAVCTASERLSERPCVGMSSTVDTLIRASRAGRTLLWLAVSNAASASLRTDVSAVLPSALEHQSHRKYTASNRTRRASRIVNETRAKQRLRRAGERMNPHGSMGWPMRMG